MNQATKRPISLDDLYWTTEHLALLLPVGRSQIYALIKRDDFPKPLTLTERGKYLWPREEVQQWLSERPRAAMDRPAAPSEARTTPMVIRRPIRRRAMA